MLNLAILMGRLTKDPELKNTTSGKEVITFNLAVDRFTKGESDFLTCTAWDKTAEFIVKYLKKGSKVVVQGRIQTRPYDRKDGSKAIATEIVVTAVDFADSKNNAPTEKEPDFDSISDSDSLPF